VLQIDAGPDELEGTAVVLTAFDDAAKYSKERKVGEAQPVGPSCPLARFVDQRLAHVKKHLPYAHHAPLTEE
jgi:hypothetical protein